MTVVTATTSCVAVLAPRFKRPNWIRSKASPCGICGGHSGIGIDFCRIISVSPLWPVFLYSFIGHLHYTILHADGFHQVKLFSLSNRKFPSYFYLSRGSFGMFRTIIEVISLQFHKCTHNFLCVFISKTFKTCGKAYVAYRTCIHFFSTPCVQNKFLPHEYVPKYVEEELKKA